MPQTQRDWAELFVRRFAADFRYVSEWGWLHWTGQRWELDRDDAQAWRAALQLGIERTQNVRDVLAQARRHELIAAKVDQWDADPFLLNTPAGTYDLRAAANLGHRREDLITRMTRVAPGAECPRFLAHLRWCVQGDTDLGRFIASWIGYCLTGGNREQCFFVGYGLGSNGKNTLFDPVLNVLGDYATVAPHGLLTSRDGTVDETAWADVAGRRFVMAAESERGDRLNEGMIKTVTGSQMIKARHLYGRRFEFPPTFKLILLTNPKPHVHGTDEGIWRRLRLVPFRNYCPDEQKDPELPRRLITEEGGGILKQLIAWSRHYLEYGLPACPVVEEETREYRQEMDVLGQFLADECRERAGALCSNTNLYAVYRLWAGNSGQREMSQKALSLALKERGYSQRRMAEGRLWEGLELKGETSG